MRIFKTVLARSLSSSFNPLLLTRGEKTPRHLSVWSEQRTSSSISKQLFQTGRMNLQQRTKQTADVIGQLYPLHKFCCCGEELQDTEVFDTFVDKAYNQFHYESFSVLVALTFPVYLSVYLLLLPIGM